MNIFYKQLIMMTLFFKQDFYLFWNPKLYPDVLFKDSIRINHVNKIRPLQLKKMHTQQMKNIIVVSTNW